MQRALYGQNPTLEGGQTVLASDGYGFYLSRLGLGLAVSLALLALGTWVYRRLSADFAVRARRAGARVARFTTPGGHSMLRRAHRWHEFARDVVLAGTGLEPMRADVTNALQQPSPQGLAVPL